MSPPAPTPSAARRRRAWQVGAIVAGLGVLLVALIAAGESSGWPFLRGAVRSGLQSLTGVPVRIEGSFRLRLIGQPMLQVGALHIGAGDGLASDARPSLLDAQDITLRWRWHDAWRHFRGAPWHLRELSAARLDAWLVRTADGHASWNLQRPATSAPVIEPVPAPSRRPHIDRLLLREGHIVVDDAPLALRLDVVVHSRGGDAEHPGQQLVAQAKGQYRGQPLSVDVQADAAMPLIDDVTVKPKHLTSLKVDARIAQSHWTFDGEAASLLSNRWLAGAVQASGPSLAAAGQPLGLVLPQTPPFTLQAHVAHDGSSWQIDVQQAHIGRSQLNGQFHVDGTSAPPRLTGRLGGPRLALRDLGPTVGTDTAPRRAGRVLPDRALNLPGLAAMAADIEINIDELDLGTPALAPLQALRARLHLAGGQLDIDALSAQVAGGRVSGHTRFESQLELPRWSAELRFEGLQVEQWVRALARPAKADGTKPAERSVLSGELQARLKVIGHGRNAADILASLGGDVHAELHKASISHLLTELAGLDVAQALGVALRGDRNLPLLCARLDASVRDGVLTPSLAVLDNRDSTLRLSGHLSLRDETLALRAVASPKDFSPLSLRSPLTISGTLAAPVVGVEARPLGLRVLAALALGSVAPAAALLPLLDPGSGKPDVPCAGSAR